jgi:hypothetical protein
MPRPDADKTLDKGFALTNGDYAVVRLRAVTDADPSTMTRAEREQMKRGFVNLRGNQALATLEEDLRRQATVEIPKESE